MNTTSPVDVECILGPIVDYIVGLCLMIGACISYIPQMHVLYKMKTVDGLNEFTIILLNFSNFCLALNSIIFNWYKFECYTKCSFWVCNAELLPFYLIMTGWVMVLVYYAVFMKYKIRNTENKILGAISYMLLYLIFIFIVLLLSISEEFGNSGPSRISFFSIFGQVMGYISAVCSAIVWLPQIYTLFKTKKIGNVSPLMFVLQTPGNIINIVFQAVLFHQGVSTWITYAVSCVEQFIILVIVTVYYIRDRNVNPSSRSMFQRSPVDQEIETLV